LIDVAACKRLLAENSAELNVRFDNPAFHQYPSLETRLSFVKDGIFALAVDIARKNSLVHAQAVAIAWTMFMNALPIQNVDNDDELKPIDEFVKLGGVELAAVEFKKRLEKGDTSMLLMFAWCATDDNATPHIVDAGLHKYGIQYISAGPKNDSNRFDTSMSFIRAASACYSTRSKLRSDGALDAVLPHLEGLKGSDDLSLRRGFRAGSVVARLAGNDEQGIGPQTLRGNPVLISTTVDILDRVLDAGPQGAVINMAINPHFITMDLLTIATSDVNKPLLKDAIPVLIKALKMRGESNPRMVVDIVKTLLLLTYDPACKTKLVTNAKELTALVQKLIVSPKYDREALTSSQLLQNELNPAPAAQPARRPSQLAGLVRRVMKDKSGTTEDAKRQPSSEVAKESKHVMLSYNWGIKEVVHRVDEMLRQNGVKTWLDVRDMKENVNDAMADAVENAYLVMVFMTSKYKESPNCRKECEYADDQGVPVCYIMGEENYKPNGWLGILVGKALWVRGWSIPVAEESLPTMMERAKPGSPIRALPPPASKPAASTESKGADSGGSNKEVLELLKSLNSKFQDLTTKVDGLVKDVAELKTKVLSQ